MCLLYEGATAGWETRRLRGAIYNSFSTLYDQTIVTSDLNKGGFQDFSEGGTRFISESKNIDLVTKRRVAGEIF